MSTEQPTTYDESAWTAWLIEQLAGEGVALSHDDQTGRQRRWTVNGENLDGFDLTIRQYCRGDSWHREDTGYAEINIRTSPAVTYKPNRSGAYNIKKIAERLRMLVGQKVHSRQLSSERKAAKQRIEDLFTNEMREFMSRYSPWASAVGNGDEVRIKVDVYVPYDHAKQALALLLDMHKLSTRATLEKKA